MRVSDCAANTAPDQTDYIVTNPNKRNICPAERRLATMVFAFHFRLAPILRGSCLPLLSSLAGSLSEHWHRMPRCRMTSMIKGVRQCRSESQLAKIATPRALGMFRVRLSYSGRLVL